MKIKAAKRWTVAGVTLVATLALTLTACSTSSTTPTGGSTAAGGTVAVNVGLSKPVMLPKGKLKIGLFMNAMSNGFEQTLSAAVVAQAKKFGWTATIIDSNYNEQTQENAMQTAITNKTYNAWVVLPIDGNASCNLVTKEAPAANILVAVAAGPECGRDLDTGNNLWAPGTYSYHAVAPSPQFDSLFFTETAKVNPGPQKVLLVGGPAVNPAHIAFMKEGEAFQKTHPDFQIQAVLNTLYTAPTAFAATQAYLQAHPDITVIMDNYSPDSSQGVVKALQSLNLAGKIHVTDMGGSSFSVSEIKAGVIQLTMPFYPKTQGQLTVQAFKDAQDGVTPKRIYDEIPGGLKNAVPITKSNVNSFAPQY